MGKTMDKLMGKAPEAVQPQAPAMGAPPPRGQRQAPKDRPRPASGGSWVRVGGRLRPAKAGERQRAGAQPETETKTEEAADG